MLASAVWFTAPMLGPLPLVIALLPWLVRLAAGQPPVRRTGLDLPFAAFLVTAAVGVWAAYDKGAAWAKFWTLTGALLFFYAVASQPRKNLWLVMGLFGLVSVGVAAFFLLTHDWSAQGVKFGAIHRMGAAWMAVRPDLNIPSIGPNGAAGVMAMTLPLLAASGIHAARKRWWIAAVGVVAGLAAVLLGLALTSSRGAWIALAAGLSVWSVWALTQRVAAWARIRPGYLFGAAMLAIGLLTAMALALAPGAALELLIGLPGPPSAADRLQLATDAIHLIRDFPLTGGGLQSFPGLYAQYIQGVPHLLVEYSHNLYLNVALEQGLPGLLALVAVLAVSLLLLVDAPLEEDPPGELLRGALLAGSSTMLVHGLVTDVLYGIQGTPILFFLSALTYAVARPAGARQPDPAGRLHPVDPVTRRRLTEFSGTALVFGLLAISWQALLLANLGAVEMAKVELAAWPTGKWDDGDRVDELAGAESLLARALAVDPTNRTANFRLGLIRMLERDYAAAIPYLERADAHVPAHRGIHKALGQSYAWAGRLEQAYLLLAPLPESASEMEIYVWWWGTMGRPDLAARAQAMSGLLSPTRQPGN